MGPFELSALLGRGGIAEVWSAVHAAQKVPVALKVVTAAYARSPAFLETFRTEIQAVARLDHPGIVMLLDHGTVDPAAEEASSGRLVAGSPYLAMELASEGSLDRLRGGIAWPDLYRVLSSLLDALAHAHARGVIHRDLKPANVLVASFKDHRPGLKLTDFGIAHASGLDADPATSARHAHGGTPSYMAPEQFFGSWRDFGPWTDLYALGCMTYTLATGEPPFRGPTARDVARMHVREAPPPLRAPRRMPAALEEWLLRLLAKDPGDRFARAADAAFALAQIEQSERRATGSGSTSLERTGEHVTRLIAESAQGERTEHMLPPFDPDPQIRAATAPESAPREPGKDELVTQLEDTRVSRAQLDFRDLSIPPELPRLDAPAALVPPMPPSWRARSVVQPPPALVGAGLRLYGLRAIPLVDREDERDRLWAALGAVARDRRARAVVVRSAAGVGKTRLVESIAERADEVGAAIVLRATHSPIPSAADGLARMFARHLRVVGLAPAEVERRAQTFLERRGASDPYEWLALAELMSPSVEGGERPRVRFSSAEEQQLALRRALARAASERPVLVWIDDAQWGGDALAFVRSLLEAQDADPSAILALITVRDEALPDRALEEEALRALARREDLETLELPRLSKGDQRRLVEELLSLEPKLAARVAARTEGNPLFAVQLVGDWVERGVLVLGEHGFALQAGESGRIPDDIHAVWAARIARVVERHGPEAKRALELAAVLGNEVDASEWRALAEATKLKIAPTLVLELIADRLAEPTQQGWIFVHGMVRETLERDLVDRGGAAAVHRAAAALLSARPRVRGLFERIGRHFLAAEAYAEACAALLGAATERWEQGELGEALALVELRRRAIARAGLPPSDPSEEEGELLRAQIEIVRGSLDLAVTLAAAVEERARKALAAETAARARWELVRVRALMAQAKGTYERGEQARAINYYQQARQLAEALGDVPSVVRAVQGIADAHYRLGDLDAAGKLYAEGLARAMDAGLAQAIAEAHWGLGYVALWRADHAAAREHFLEQCRVLERLGNRLGLAHAYNSLGELARMEGDLEAAEREYRRAIALHHAVGSSGILVTKLNVALVLLMRQDYAATERVLLPLFKELLRSGERGHILAAHCQILPCHAHNRDFSAWDRELALAEQLLDETGLCDGDVALSLEIAGALALRAGQAARAARVLERARDLWASIGRAEKRAKVEALLEDARSALR